MKALATVLFSALVLASSAGCARNAKPAAPPSEAARAGSGTVVVYVAGREGLPGRVAMASEDEASRGEARDLPFLRRNAFVAMPAQGKQKLLVPYAGSSIDLDVKEGERVFVKLSFKGDRFVFDRVDEGAAAQEMSKCTSLDSSL